MTRPARAVARALEPPDAAGRQWVHLLTPGEIATRDGRRYRLSDPEGVIAAFRRAAVDLPVDFEHQTESRRPPDPAPAAGWITRLERRDDGLWGLVEWTAKAAAMIRAREYRYISPAFRYDPATLEVKALSSAGLVHHPAMRLTALASEGRDMDEPETVEDALTQIAQALGLEGGADFGAILDSLRDLRETARKGVPADAVAELLRDRTMQTAQMAESRATELVDAALRDGYLTPAMRPWAVELCRSDPASFDAFLRTAVPAWAHLGQPSHAAKRPPETALAAQDHGAAAEIAATLGVDPARLTGE